MKYLKCNYLEKKSEKKGINIFYKNLGKMVYVLPAQLLCPYVSLKDDLLMTAAISDWVTVFRFIYWYFENGDDCFKL